MHSIVPQIAMYPYFWCFQVCLVSVASASCTRKLIRESLCISWVSPVRGCLFSSWSLTVLSITPLSSLSYSPRRHKATERYYNHSAPSIADSWRTLKFIFMLPSFLHGIYTQGQPYLYHFSLFTFVRTRTNVFFVCLTFRHRVPCILGQAFRYSPENAFYIFNQQIYFIIWHLLDRASLI